MRDGADGTAEITEGPMSVDHATRSPASAGGTVAVLEADPTGHRLLYIRHLIEAAGHERCVVFLSSYAARSEEYAAHPGSTSATTEVLDTADTHRALLNAGVSRARASGARKLILPDGDRYLLPLLLLMLRRPCLPLEVRLLLMRTTAVRGPERLRLATIVKPVLVQLLRIFPQIHILFLTDALGVVTTRKGFPGIRPVNDPVLPPGEPGYERPSWIPADPKMTTVGVFGVISPRKNLPLLVRAAAWHPEVTLVVGGRLEPDVRAFLGTDARARELVASGRVVVMDRLLSAQELAAALATVDMVAVLHDNDAPSGILAEACVRHTPVLVPYGGWLARVAESTGIGAASPLTAMGIAEGIRAVTRNRKIHVDATRRYAVRINASHFTEGLLGE